MARKTDGEKIDELGEKFNDLGRDVAVLHERLNKVDLNELGRLATTLDERLDNLRDELKDLKRDLEEARRKLWLIVPPLLAALVSVGLMTLVNYLSRR